MQRLHPKLTCVRMHSWLQKSTCVRVQCLHPKATRIRVQLARCDVCIKNQLCPGCFSGFKNLLVLRCEVRIKNQLHTAIRNLKELSNVAETVFHIGIEVSDSSRDVCFDVAICETILN